MSCDPMFTASFHQGTAGMPGSVESGDQFGLAVHLLDTSGDRLHDLAVTAPGENQEDGAVGELPDTASERVESGWVPTARPVVGEDREDGRVQCGCGSDEAGRGRGPRVPVRVGDERSSFPGDQ